MDFFRNAMPICLAHAETLVHATIHFARALRAGDGVRGI